MAKDQIELFKNSLKSLDRVNDLLKNHKDNKEKILLDIYKLLIDKEPRIKSFKKVNINFLNEVLEIFFNNLNEISMSFYEAQNSLYIFLDDNNISPKIIFNDSNKKGFSDYHEMYGEVVDEIIKSIHVVTNLSTDFHYDEILQTIGLFTDYFFEISDIIDLFLEDVDTVLGYLFKKDLIDEFDEEYIDKFIEVSVENIYLRDSFAINTDTLIQRTMILIFSHLYNGAYKRFLKKNKDLDKVDDYLTEDKKEEHFLSCKKDLLTFSKMIASVTENIMIINKLNRKITKNENPLFYCEENKKYWKDMFQEFKKINESFLFLKKTLKY